jgi:hypothetical protein
VPVPLPVPPSPRPLARAQRGANTIVHRVYATLMTAVPPSALCWYGGSGGAGALRAAVTDAVGLDQLATGGRLNTDNRINLNSGMDMQVQERAVDTDSS